MAEKQLFILTTTAVHGPGATSVAYFQQSGCALITSGADGRVCSSIVNGDPTMLLAEPGGIFTAAALTDGQLFLGDSVHVKVYTINKLDQAALNDPKSGWQFNSPVRAISVSACGSIAAAAGDAANIRLQGVTDKSIRRQLSIDGGVHYLALDPTGTYLAAAQADGHLTIYDHSLAGEAGMLFKKRVLPQLAAGSAGRNGLSWHPDGGVVLAAPGQDNDVIFYDRLSWKASGYLTGQHSQPVNLVSFSPNGLYAVTAGRDQRVCVWDSQTCQCIAVATAPLVVSDMAWHPSGNELAVATEGGEVGRWPSPVPHNLPGPAVPVEELERMAAASPDKPRCQSRGAAPEVSGHTAGDQEEDADDMKDFISDHGDEADDSRRQPAPASRGRASWRPVSAPAAPPPQPPFQPGSTPRGHAIQPAGAAHDAHFLAYNMLGSVVSRAVDAHRVIEVSFHDQSQARRRVPLLTDHFGYTLGSLSESGAVYACPSTSDAPSMLVFRPFDSWSSNSDWSVGLPASEEAVNIVAGQHFVAAATSRELLRVFSLGGIQSHVVSLAGPVVAMATQGPWLAIVQHAGEPSARTKAQNLKFTLYNMSDLSQAAAGPLPITSGSTLAWLGFNHEGMLATYDSTGILRLRGQDFGGSWVPVFDAAAEHKAGETIWPVGLNAAQLTCIVCAPPATCPTVLPRPFFTFLELRVPGVTAATGAPSMDNALLLQSMALTHAQHQAAAGSSDYMSGAEVLANKQKDVEKIRMTLFLAALKSQRLAKALEYLEQVYKPDFLTGALQLAELHHSGPLAERIQMLIQQRRDAEAFNTQAAGVRNNDQVMHEALPDDRIQQDVVGASGQENMGPDPGVEGLATSNKAGGAINLPQAPVAAPVDLKRKPLVPAAVVASGINNPFMRRSKHIKG